MKDDSLEGLVEEVLRSQRFAVLATADDGQPHTSLMAFVTLDGPRCLVVATHRDTKKYANLKRNCKVALLIEAPEGSSRPRSSRAAVSALGTAEELTGEARSRALRAYVHLHPDLAEFAESDACALIGVKVARYQIAEGVEKIRWWSVRAATET
jgi:nitroimidazol reductase NimA-like FMN-containing flavoprotein (pyridoxamine 5'-phosphate oxidase superfamily)